ncbi:50S ribosomal protein L22 [Candidatus Curtissbacteria bacterium]|nr:50S ribosomal protein L22 [Candidatus Curtissbacteria bacterium]
METQATVKNIRISPEKVNLLVAQIKPMSPVQAIKVLKFVNKSSSEVLAKLIKSAIANAKHNQGAQESDLMFKEIIVTKGPSYKRFQPVSRGRAHHILKRTSQIKVILQSTTPTKAQPVAKAKTEDSKAMKGKEK